MDGNPLFEKCVEDVRKLTLAPRLDDHTARLVVQRVFWSIGEYNQQREGEK